MYYKTYMFFSPYLLQKKLNKKSVIKTSGRYSKSSVRQFEFQHRKAKIWVQSDGQPLIGRSAFLLFDSHKRKWKLSAERSYGIAVGAFKFTASEYSSFHQYQTRKYRRTSTHPSTVSRRPRNTRSYIKYRIVLKGHFRLMYIMLFIVKIVSL